MENNISISIKGISKKYRLFNSPRERLWEALHPFKKKYHHEFWALKDITLNIKKGITLGIVGRNGSGKSSLLQIICSVLQPTTGTIEAKGRISALLELGAGFNSEFTGRENVLQNGILMGFKPKEMKDRMPLIESFAEIDEFIDQPVKVYSSGMFARLAFALAINVDPDILVIDEALAVGDAKFQHKCFQKFVEFQEQGKTILFVSHDMHLITRQCDHVILLENGYLIKEGEPEIMADAYYSLMMTGTVKTTDVMIAEQSIVKTKSPKKKSADIATLLEEFFNEIPSEDKAKLRRTYNKNEYRYGDKRSTIMDYLIVCNDEYDPFLIFSKNKVDFYIKVKFNQFVEFPVFGIGIKSMDGILIYATNTRFMKIKSNPAEESEVLIYKFSINMNLQAGDYFIDLGSGEGQGDEGRPLDTRSCLIHLRIESRERFDGLAVFDIQYEEICRKNTIGSSDSF